MLISMKELSDEEAAGFRAGAGACVTSIVLAATVGSLFGGAGALVGAAAAAAGSACLAIL